MDMEKHAADLQNAFLEGAFDELEKIADAEGLTDMEKMAIVRQVGELVSKGLTRAGQAIGHSGAKAGQRTMDEMIETGGRMAGGKLSPQQVADLGRTMDPSQVRGFWGVGGGAHRRELGERLVGLGVKAKQHAGTTGGLALGAGGIGVAGTGAAALSR